MKVIAFAHMKSKKGFNKLDYTISTLIQFFTRSQYFHTEVLLDGYWYSAFLNGGKVIKRKLRPLMNKYDYTFLEIDKEEETLLRNYLNSIVGKEYDLSSILLTQILGLKWSDTKKLYCTEVGLVALHQIHHLLLTKDDGTITPQQFFDKTKHYGLAKPERLNKLLKGNQDGKFR